MKKSLFLIAVAALSAATLSSCGGGGGDSTSSTTSQSSSTPESQKYTAKFETNGGTAVESFLTDKIESAPISTKTDYTFVSWCLDSALKNAVTFPYTLTADTTFYAKWKRDAVTPDGDEIISVKVGKNTASAYMTCSYDDTSMKVNITVQDDVIENYVALININKFYDKNVHAVKDFNLEVAQHEFVAFVGPSGCGKSTTLRMIAGLEEISSGELYIDGLYSNDIVPQNRDIAMVFQSYSLYPNMTVYENMAFSLKVRKYSKEEIDQRVKNAAKMLQITELLDRKPKQLSGGQRQRVALGRAVVRDAKVFLMDEPLSNLDAKLRVSMRSEIIKLHRRINATTIYVTHDQIEAMTMADRIVIMDQGIIQQIGTPFEIYHHPANRFVASFIGSPAMNFADASYDKGEISFSDGYSLKLDKDEIKKHDEFYKNLKKEFEDELSNAEKELAEEEKRVSSFKGLKLKRYEHNKNNKLVTIQNKIADLKTKISKIDEITSGKKHEITFGVRPEDIKISAKKSEFTKKIDISELLGDEYYLHFDFGGSDFLSKVSIKEVNDLSGEKNFYLEPKKLHIFDKVTERTIL